MLERQRDGFGRAGSVAPADTVDLPPRSLPIFRPRPHMHATLPLLQSSDFPAIRRQATATLQVNLGYRCNQSCVHCHVNAGPNRTEMMDAETMALIPQVLAARGIGALDLTGGAPELHAGFRDLVRSARALGVKVIDRCNLTLLFEPGPEGL